jgi:hypothetical protein
MIRRIKVFICGCKDILVENSDKKEWGFHNQKLKTINRGVEKKRAGVKKND